MRSVFRMTLMAAFALPSTSACTSTPDYFPPCVDPSVSNQCPSDDASGDEATNGSAGAGDAEAGPTDAGDDISDAGPLSAD